MTKNSTKTLMLIPVIAIAMIAGTASQAMAIEGNDEASVKVRAVEFKNQGFYEVHLRISSGNEDLAAGTILVTSDVSSKEVNYFAVPSQSTTDVRTIIKVNDRSSVDAKLINIDTKSTAKLVDVIPVVDGEASVKIRAVELKNQGFYEVHLLISSGNEDLAAGKILVTSDASSKEVNFDAVPSESTTDVRTIIKVNDRSSVVVQLIT
jgi:flagella basal body P-ring formation protein FlgA